MTPREGSNVMSTETIIMAFLVVICLLLAVIADWFSAEFSDEDIYE